MATRWSPKRTTGTPVAGKHSQGSLVARDDYPLRWPAEAGGGDPRMAVTADRRLQAGSCGQRSATCSRSLLADDKENLKKIKDAKNRRPEAEQQTFSCRRKSFREVLTRDSGNGRHGTESVHPDASHISPKHTRQSTSSSAKSTRQAEARSSEIVDPHSSAFHPFSHKSCNTSPRRTNLEKSSSVQCRNKNKTLISTNKTPAKYSSTCTKQLLAEEQIESTEINLGSKLSDSQVMHKSSTSGRLHNRQADERRTVTDGLSSNEQDGTQIDSRILSKGKVRAVPQQNVTSSFSRTCNQTTHLSKDSRTEQLLPHYTSTTRSKTMASREQTNKKNKGAFCSDHKVMRSAIIMTPSVNRKTRAKNECQPSVSSKGVIQCSVSGELASDRKENPHDVQEYAKKQAFDKNKSPPRISRGQVSDRNKSPQNVEEFSKEQNIKAPYFEINSSLETSTTHSLLDKQICISPESILKTNASDRDMNVWSPALEEATLATDCKLVSKPDHHSAELDNSDTRYLQLGFEDENVKDISGELVSYNFGSKKHHQKPEIDKNKISILFHSNLCDDNNGENIDQEPVCDVSRVSNILHGQDSDNTIVENNCQEVYINRDKTMCPKLESDVASVSGICLDMEIDNSKVQNVCSELERNNSKVQNIYLKLKDDDKFQNVNCKFQNYNSKCQNICLEMGEEDNVDNVCHEKDTAWQILGLCQQLKSSKDQSNQPAVDISMWKRTGLLNKILDKAELNLESLASLIPQLDEDCTGIMSPQDFRGLNFSTQDIGMLQRREEENNVYDEKLEKALKESEQLLDELRLLNGRGMDVLLNQCAGKLEKAEEVVPGVHRSVSGCKKDLKMFMAYVIP
ncbi:hypothetical protein BsWGS_24488 [Bradybaena similaris]